MKVRPNFAEGMFYAADQHELIKMIEDRLAHERPKINLSLAEKQIIGGWYRMPDMYIAQPKRFISLKLCVRVSNSLTQWLSSTPTIMAKGCRCRSTIMILEFSFG